MVQDDPRPNWQLNKALAYIEKCNTSKYRWRYEARKVETGWRGHTYNMRQGREYVKQKSMTKKAFQLASAGWNVFMYERISGRWEPVKKSD